MNKLHDEWAYWFDDLNEKPSQFENNLQMLEHFETIDVLVILNIRNSGKFLTLCQGYRIFPKTAH